MNQQLDSTAVWTAIITPFLPDGKIDFSSLKQLLLTQQSAGCGLLMLGSTGEALNLSQSEKEQILDFTIELKLGLPIMVGVGGFNLQETISWIKYLESKKVDCYLLVTPLYAKPGRHGQTHWFKSLMDQATRPCMLYNIPGRTGVSLNFTSVNDLKDHPRFWAIKEASGKTTDFQKYREANPKASMYSGDDGMMLDFAKLGAIGVVSVASNVWPNATLKVVELCVQGEFPEDAMWKECCDSLFEVSNPVPVKRLLAEKKIIASKKMRPPLHEDDLISAKNQIEADNRMSLWIASQGKNR